MVQHQPCELSTSKNSEMSRSPGKSCRPAPSRTQDQDTPTAGVASCRQAGGRIVHGLDGLGSACSLLLFSHQPCKTLDTPCLGPLRWNRGMLVHHMAALWGLSDPYR